MKDERGQGLEFYLCFMCGSHPWGAAAFILCLFILLLKYLIVRQFPPPSSHIYELGYIGAETRKEGRTFCQTTLTAEGDRGAEEVGQQEEAETASGCPRWWCWSNRRTGGMQGPLLCSWVEVGWLPPERERRSRRRSPGGRSLLHSAMSGVEQGTADWLPAALDRRSHRHPPGGGRASGRPPKTIAWHHEWEPLSWLRTKQQCDREPDHNFCFSLSPLGLSSSFPLLFSCLICLYPQVRHSPPEGHQEHLNTLNWCHSLGLLYIIQSEKIISDKVSRKACVEYVTCVVCIMVRSFMQDTPGPMTALNPAVPNSIRAPKHFCSSDMALSLTIDRTAAAVFGFCKSTKNIF